MLSKTKTKQKEDGHTILDFFLHSEEKIDAGREALVIALKSPFDT